MDGSICCHLANGHILKPNDKCDDGVCHRNASWPSFIVVSNFGFGTLQPRPTIFERRACSDLLLDVSTFDKASDFASFTQRPVPIPAPNVIIIICLLVNTLWNPASSTSVVVAAITPTPTELACSRSAGFSPCSNDFSVSTIMSEGSKLNGRDLGPGARPMSKGLQEDSVYDMMQARRRNLA